MVIVCLPRKIRKEKEIGTLNLRFFIIWDLREKLSIQFIVIKLFSSVLGNFILLGTGKTYNLRTLGFILFYFPQFSHSLLES